jgi:thioredoxin 1
MLLGGRTQLTIIALIAIIIAATTVVKFMPAISSKSSISISDSDRLYDLVELTDKNVTSAINSSSFYILEFYYPGCSHCSFVAKIASELSNELNGQIIFARMNVSSNPQTLKKYKVSSFPTLLFFDEGVLVDRKKGNISKSDLLNDLKSLKPDLDTSNVKLDSTVSGIIVLAKWGADKPTQPMLITDLEIDSAIKKYPLLVVDGFATWCNPCKTMNVTIEQLSGELKGQVAFGLIDAQKNNVTKKRYNITDYPSLLIFKDGKLVNKLIGNRQKSSFVSELKKYYPQLDTSNVKIAQTALTSVVQSSAKPKQTPEQVCANMTKSDKPLLEAFVVSRCPFGLQMQRILAEVVSKLPAAKDYLKIRYIGSVSNNTITSMHGNDEAQENLRQICMREEQPERYWDYLNCYMKEGKSSDCQKSLSIDVSKLSACIKDSSCGLIYAQKDFDLADDFKIAASPTLTMNSKIVSEFDFATDTTSGRSPEALKELLCCGFNKEPSFCAKQLNKTQATTMFQVKTPTAAASAAKISGKDIPLIKLGKKNPAQAMLITDASMDLAISQYPLLVVEVFANWCGFCKLFNVTISDLASELQGQVAFGLIDMDRSNDTKARYNITAVPTWLIFKDGKLAERVVGNKDKATVVARIQQIEPKLNASKVKIVKAAAIPAASSKPRLTPEQVCANMTKSDRPLLQAFVVSRCPFGLQMQRILADIVNESKDAQAYLKVMYIGSVANNTITSMHGDLEAQENLRQICIRKEQEGKYWDYLRCYMRQDNSSDCQKSVSLDLVKLNSCTCDSSRGLAYAQKDFDLANKFQITGSPTLIIGDKIVSEYDFATNTTNGRSPEALKELLCCGFKVLPTFCSQEMNKSRAATMFSFK